MSVPSLAGARERCRSWGAAAAAQGLAERGWGPEGGFRPSLAPSAALQVNVSPILFTAFDGFLRSSPTLPFHVPSAGPAVFLPLLARGWGHCPRGAWWAATQGSSMVRPLLLVQAAWTHGESSLPSLQRSTRGSSQLARSFLAALWSPPATLSPST